MTSNPTPAFDRAVAVVAGLFAWLASGAAVAGDFAEFFQPPRFDRMVIAPDGETIAAVAPGRELSRLLFIDASSQNPPIITDFGPDSHIVDVDWLGNDDAIVTLELGHRGINSLPRPRDLWMIGSDGENRRAVLRQTYFDLEIADQSALITHFDSQSPRILRVDAAKKGRTETVMRAPVRYGVPLADRNGNVRLFVGNDESGDLIVLYRPAGKDEWLQKGRFDSRRGSLEPLRFHSDGRRAYMLSNVASDRDQIILYDLEDGSLTPIHADERYDVASGLFVGDDLIGARMTTGENLIRAVDSPTLQALVNALGPEMIYAVSFSRTGDRAVVQTRDPATGGHFYLFDREAGTLSSLAEKYASFNDLPKRQPIEIAARDGTALLAFLTLPKDQDNPPLIVMTTAQPHETFLPGFDPVSAALASRGIAVLQVLTRGGSGLGRAFEFDNFGAWGEAVQDDLADAAASVAARGDVDAHRVCLAGSEYGGYAALMALLRSPDLFACGLIHQPYADLTLLQQGGWLAGFDLDTEDGKAYLAKNLGDDRGALAQRSPVPYLEALRTPTLVLFEDDHDAVPNAHARRLREAARESSAPLTFDRLEPGETGNWSHIYTRYVEFVRTRTSHD